MNQLNKPLLVAMGLAAFACAPVVIAQPYAYVPDYAGNVVERHVGELSAQELQRWFDTTKPQ